MNDAGGARLDRLGGRMLASLLAAAEQRQVSAFVGMNDAQLGVVVLPDLDAGVAILDRTSEGPAAIKARIDALLSGHANGVLHLVLAGGANPAEDRAILTEADRGAHDPNRLGVHLLGSDGRLARVAGRRLGLLGEAAALLRTTLPLDEATIASHNGRAQQRREEAAAFAAALDQRPQRAIRSLGALCILFYALEVIWGTGRLDLGRVPGRTLLNMGANSLLAVLEDGQVWRLVSYAFLHGDGTHILVNLIALFSFGTFLEGVLGWRRIVVLYAVTALAGGAASAFIGRVGLSVGASGAVWGLMAAGAAITLRRSALLPPLIAGRLRPRLFAVLAVNLAFSLWGYFAPGLRIDLWAHAGGGLAGFALALSGGLTRGLGGDAGPQSPAAKPRWLRVAAVLAIVLMAGSVAAAFATGQPWQRTVLLEPDQMA